MATGNYFLSKYKWSVKISTFLTTIYLKNEEQKKGVTNRSVKQECR